MKKKSVILSIIIVLVLLVGGYIGGSIYFSERFLPNTSWGDLAISYDSVGQANQKLAKELHGKKVAVSENGQNIATLTPAQVEASIDATELLTKEQQKQNKWTWPLAFFNEQNIASETGAVTYNDTALQSFIDSLALDSQERTKPVNAQVVSENGTFVIKQEVLGNTVDRAALSSALVASLTQQADDVQIEDAYEQPTLTGESEAVIAALDTLSGLADTKVIYTIAGTEEVVPKDQIVTWLSLNGEGKPTVNKEAIATYLRGVNDQYSTYRKTREFNSTNRGTVSIPPGEYGWSIDIESETESLAAAILAGQEVKLKPVISGSGYHEDGTDIGSTYIEVDLQAQMMYYYKDGMKALETQIVSGHPQTPTPVGVFYAWNKEEDTELVGNNPRRGNDYVVPVDYWVPLTWDGIGIHDASWQASFASTQWQTDGSNGCINTPPGKMAELFKMIEVGTPVILF